MDNETDGTDDFTAFEAQATGAAEPEKVEAPKAPIGEQEPDEGDEPNPEVNDEAGEPEGDDEPEKGKRNKPAHERIGELTKARREAERRAEAAEERLRQLESGKQPETQAPAVEIAERPDPNAVNADGSAKYEFGEYDPQFIEDLTEWKVDARLAKREAETVEKERQRTFEQQATQLDTSWSEQAEKASERYDDFSEVIADYQDKQPCPPILAIAIQESEFGADVAYHLAKNPKENRELAELSVTNPLEAAKRFGRLEARFDSADKGKPQPKRVTDAPTPPEQRARGSGGHYQASGDTTDFAAFERVANKQ